MKNLLVIALIITSNLIFAQESKKGFSLSLKGGISFANQYGDVYSRASLKGETTENFRTSPHESDQFRTGVNMGVLLNYRFGKHISLGIGSKYIKKGSRINELSRWTDWRTEEIGSGERIDGYTIWKQDFLTFEFPISFYFPINQNEIFLRIGYSYSYLLYAKEVGKVKLEGVTYDYSKERTKNEHENGVFIGCGYSYALPKKLGNILFEFEWNKSIIDNLGANYVGGPIPQIFNQSLSIILGYKFKI
jgi:hypothetical protein